MDPTDLHYELPRRTERMYQMAVSAVDKKWGGTGPLLGPELRRALVAQELLRLLAAQDEAIPADVIRELLNGTWENLNADPRFNGA